MAKESISLEEIKVALISSEVLAGFLDLTDPKAENVIISIVGYGTTGEFQALTMAGMVANAVNIHSQEVSLADAKTFIEVMVRRRLEEMGKVVIYVNSDDALVSFETPQDAEDMLEDCVGYHNGHLLNGFLYWLND